MKNLTYVFCLLCVLFCIPLNTYSKRKIAQTEVDDLTVKVFKRILMCKARYEAKESSSITSYLGCTYKYIDPNQDDDLKKDLSLWFKDVMETSELKECPEKIFRLFPKTNDDNQIVKCFDFTRFGERKSAVLYFTLGNTILIKGVQFH